MAEDKYNLDFEKINNLYAEYKEALTLENVDAYRLKKKNELFTQIWNTACKMSKYKNGIQNGEIDGFTIFEACKDSLKCYNPENNKDSYFSKYVFTAISKKVSSELQHNDLNKKTGFEVSLSSNKKINKIKKLLKQFNNNINKTALAMNTTPETIKNLINFESSHKVSLDAKNGINRKKETTHLEDEIISNENNKTDFDTINTKWIEENEKNKPVLSDYLTVTILDMIEKKQLIFCSEDPDEVAHKLCKYDFINKTTVKKYFEDKTFILPSFKEIGEMYNLSKSGISKKWSRFVEKIKN